MPNHRIASQVLSASPRVFDVLIYASLMVYVMDKTMHYRFKKMKDGKDTPLTLFLKALPTATAVLLIWLGTSIDGFTTYSRWMMAGMLLCLAGDVVLGFHFVTGGGLFFLGHVCYIAGLWGQQTLAPVHGVVFFYAYVLLFVFLLTFRKSIPGRLLFAGVCVYAAALAVLLAASIPLIFTEKTPQAYYAAWGALLFVISDMTLCDNMLNNRPVLNQYISLGIYYTAQFLLGISTMTVL